MQTRYMWGLLRGWSDLFLVSVLDTRHGVYLQHGANTPVRDGWDGAGGPAPAVMKKKKGKVGVG